MKRMLIVVAAVLVALLAGWIVGMSGKSALTASVEAAQLRDQLHEARAAVLDARLAIYSVNFGDASRHLETARASVAAAAARLKNANRDEDIRRLTLASTKIDEAQRLAGELSQDANSRAADAAKAIDEVLRSAGVR